MPAELELPQFRASRLGSAHAWLLVGTHGHASTYEAGELAKSVVGKAGLVQTLQKADDKAGITIEQVRELYIATRAKTEHKQIWIIENAETMSLDAQNAFLKLLEEPPLKVSFILCVPEATAMLPTIRSRSQIIHCLPVRAKQARLYLTKNNLTGGNTMTQLLFLADGSATELVRLTHEPNYQKKQIERAAIAKQLISSSALEKISLAHKLAADRSDTLAVLHLALRMLTTLAPSRATQATAITQLQRFLEAYERIRHNGNTRVQLLQAIL